RPGAAARGPVQAAGRGRDARLGDGADRTRPDRARSRDRGRHARRAAQVPGRHSEDPGFGGPPPARPDHPRAAGGRRVTRPAAPPGGDGGRLAENIMHFARVLRRAGLDVGTGQVLDAVQAVEVCGLASRRDLYWTLHAVFVKSKADRAVFDQAFHIFWRKPAFLQQMMAMMLPEIAVPAQPRRRDPGEARVGEALFGGRDRPAGAARESEV